VGRERLKRRDAEATRERILVAAAEAFTAAGFAGARLAPIAARAGVEQALIHHYFAGKAGLYAAVVDRAVGSIEIGTAALLARPVERDRRAARALVEDFVAWLFEFHERHREIFALLRHEAEAPVTSKKLHRRSSARAHVESRVAPLFVAAVARVERWRRKALVPADVEPRAFALSLIAQTGLFVRDGALAAALLGATPAPVLTNAYRDEVRRAALARLGLDG